MRGWLCPLAGVKRSAATSQMASRAEQELLHIMKISYLWLLKLGSKQPRASPIAERCTVKIKASAWSWPKHVMYSAFHAQLTPASNLNLSVYIYLYCIKVLVWEMFQKIITEHFGGNRTFPLAYPNLWNSPTRPLQHNTFETRKSGRPSLEMTGRQCHKPFLLSNKMATRCCLEAKALQTMSSSLPSIDSCEIHIGLGTRYFFISAIIPDTCLPFF